MPLTMTWLDLFAVLWFVLCWVAYGIAADHTRLRELSVAHMMNEFRLHWMMAMLQRDLRIIATGSSAIRAYYRARAESRVESL